MVVLMGGGDSGGKCDGNGSGNNGNCNVMRREAVYQTSIAKFGTSATASTAPTRHKSLKPALSWSEMLVAVNSESALRSAATLLSRVQALPCLMEGQKARDRLDDWVHTQNQTKSRMPTSYWLYSWHQCMEHSGSTRALA
ncbi:hypothetical protein PoB_006497900 [Plakobranchus ocellatus]|uniref:Uncharacterized protein n=1 Tax=Plakobranchus ocellatus TaxID=259542 RepID=A0AAV4D2T4_9GAST|nr:hypothetical protein PoB_006497900 [Plakobranchus ocellatus]